MKAKPFLAFIVPVLIMLGCKRKGEFTHRFLLNKDLYVEFYRAGIIGNTTSIYITDSFSFRKYLGNYDPENQFIHVYTQGDTLLTEKKYGDRVYETQGKIIEKRIYSISRLKDERKFD